MEQLKMGETEYSALARVLRRVEFFAPLTFGQLEQVLPYIRYFSAKSNETVFKQGDAGDAFYIIYDGAVQIQVKKGFFGFSHVVKNLGPGDIFGEMALLFRQPRTATVKTVVATKLFSLTSSDFEAMLKRNPSVASAIKTVAEMRRLELAQL